jgi:hypothetical protein
MSLYGWKCRHAQYVLYCSPRDADCLHQLPCRLLWTPDNGYLHCTDNDWWSHNPGWSWRRSVMDWTCLPPFLYPLPCRPTRWCFPKLVPPVEGKLPLYCDNQLCHFHVLPNTLCWTNLHRLLSAPPVPLSTYFTTQETNSTCSHGPSFTSQ